MLSRRSSHKRKLTDDNDDKQKRDTTTWIQIPNAKEGSDSYWLAVAPQRRPECPAYGDECRLPLTGAARGHCATECAFTRTTDCAFLCMGCSNSVEHRWICLNCDASFCELCFIGQRTQFGQTRSPVSRFIRSSRPIHYPPNLITRGLIECTACVATIRCFGCLGVYKTSDPERGCGNCAKQLTTVLMDAIPVFPLEMVKLVLMLLLIERNEWFSLQFYESFPPQQKK